MRNFLQNWRQKLALAWPRLTRLERLTAYFAGLSLFLLAISKLVALFGRDSGLDGWFRFAGFITFVLGLFVAARYVRRVLMWRLRNRLIVTYVFIGVIPVVLLALIGLLSAYLFGWQFATYIATSDVQKEISTLQALNHRSAVQMASRIERGTPLTPELLSTYVTTSSTGRPAEMTAWYGGKSFTLAGQEPAAPPPSGEAVGRIVVDGNRLFFRVADTEPAGKDKLVLISSVPLDNKSLELIGAGLGEISFTLFTPNRPGEKQNESGFRITTDESKPNRKITVGNESLDLKDSANNPESLHAGKLAPAAAPMDRIVTGGTLVPVLDWKSGQSRSALLGVLTRPSLLYDRLFVTVGQSTNLIIAVLTGVAIVFGVIELCALFIGLGLTRTMTGSIAKLYVATENVNRGDLSHRIDVRREDQLGALERSFNSMTASLERLLEEQKEKQRLENELVIAQEVQAQLFPTHTHEVPGLDLYGICRPARTVSGDYYDFLPFEEGKVAIAAGDVSGKGISAALLMATIHSAVRAYSLEAAVTPQMATAAAYSGSSLAYSNGDLSPAMLMSLLNRQLYRSTPAEKYATLFLGAYSTRTRVLTYCNAGHLPPVVLSLDGRVRRLDAGGTVVGLFNEVSFDEGELRLDPGDIVLAYSDGLTEPENEFGEFGEERLIDLIRENRHQPLERISEAVMSAVLDWIGGNEQPDDMTLVLARPA